MFYILLLLFITDVDEDVSVASDSSFGDVLNMNILPSSKARSGASITTSKRSGSSSKLSSSTRAQPSSRKKAPETAVELKSPHEAKIEAAADVVGDRKVLPTKPAASSTSNASKKEGMKKQKGLLHDLLFLCIIPNPQLTFFLFLGRKAKAVKKKSNTKTAVTKKVHASLKFKFTNDPQEGWTESQKKHGMKISFGMYSKIRSTHPVRIVRKYLNANKNAPASDIPYHTEQAQVLGRQAAATFTPEREAELQEELGLEVHERDVQERDITLHYNSLDLRITRLFWNDERQRIFSLPQNEQADAIMVSCITLSQLMFVVLLTSNNNVSSIFLEQV